MKKTHDVAKTSETLCYHCGEKCRNDLILFEEKNFCCEGCKLVFELLEEKNLCVYYDLNRFPGIQTTSSSSGRFSYLDEDNIRSRLIGFTDSLQTQISFYIPEIHCTSCIWLLENMHVLNKNIQSCRVNFLKKEVTITFDTASVRLSEVVSLLANIGYAPLINLNDLEKKTADQTSKTQLIKIGLAGFCFGNIMMLSFPEYFSLGNFYDQTNLRPFLGYANLSLAIPVLLYSASDFFVSAYKSIRHQFLNIDTPIALAILVTFIRSVYEIVSGTGAGYLDSMSGIIFFMLLGRFFQNRTYQTLSFERDYKSYFPLGVSVKTGINSEVNQPVSELKKGDILIIRSNELIPADSLLLSDLADIDYSFITGESKPQKRRAGELIYAGGKQLTGAVELVVEKPVSQSYLTQLWNKQDETDTTKQENPDTTENKINRYFTLTVLSLAFLSALFWLFTDSSRTLNAFTAILIVACPCGLLLTNSFAKGTLLRILGRNKFYLKNAGVIDKLAKIDTILFDKTGTITHGSAAFYSGRKLTGYEFQLITSLASQSSHPLSRKIAEQFKTPSVFQVFEFEEILGGGLQGIVDGKSVRLGSSEFISGGYSPEINQHTSVLVAIEGEIPGQFDFKNAFRNNLKKLLSALSQKYVLKLLTGDNDSERTAISTKFGKNCDLLFNMKPDEKMQHVRELKKSGNHVLMIGDGLNDAGALKESDVGIAVSDNTNTFSPACDAILDGSAFSKLPAFLELTSSAKKVVVSTFALSLVYNLTGLFFAVQGNLSPVIAAILMPLSTVTIVLVSTGFTALIAQRKGL